MSSAFFTTQQRYVWVSAGGYVLFAGSLVIFVLLTEGVLW